MVALLSGRFGFNYPRIYNKEIEMGEVVKHDRYSVGEWREEMEHPWWAWVYVGGSMDIADRVCREAVFPKGLCVTLEPVKYYFGGGTEDGFRVGLIQYPPFSETEDELMDKAKDIGKKLCEANYQWSFTVVAYDECVFISRRNK